MQENWLQNYTFTVGGLWDISTDNGQGEAHLSVWTSTTIRSFTSLHKSTLHSLPGISSCFSWLVPYVLIISFHEIVQMFRKCFIWENSSERWRRKQPHECIPSGFLLLLVTLHGIASVLCQQLHVSLGCSCCLHRINSHKKRLLHIVDVFGATGTSCFTKCWNWFWPSYR